MLSCNKIEAFQPPGAPTSLWLHLHTVIEVQNMSEAHVPNNVPSLYCNTLCALLEMGEQCSGAHLSALGMPGIHPASFYKSPPGGDHLTAQVFYLSKYPSHLVVNLII